MRKIYTKTLIGISFLAPFSSLVFGLFFSVSLVASAGGISPADVIALANSARAKAGLSPLTENAKLSDAARAKAQDMFKHDYFAHTSPDGIAPWHWIKQLGYRYKAAGENLAINFDTAKEQHNAWMKSPTHKANILNTQYQEIGVAVVKGKIDGEESVVTVEFFGTPFYAVADRTAPVTETIVPAEVQGVETQAETTLPEIMPPLPPEAIPSQNIAQVSQGIEGKWLEWLNKAVFSFTILLLFSILAAPGAILANTYRALFRTLKEKREETAENMRDGKGYNMNSHGLLKP